MRLLLAVFLLAAPSLAAQPLSDNARAALVTIAPGDEVYSRWGHTAIRIEDPSTGLDVLYNYGTFEFTDTFVFRFAYGQLDYLLSVWPTSRAYASYIQDENRSIIEQTLRLTPPQTQTLFDLLEANALPENRTYRYDFLFDNCSTRPRDIIEQALGDSLAAPTPTGKTFRDLIDPFLREVPALDTGLDLLLALPVDREASRREATFLPDTLAVLFSEAMISTPDGPRPLVVRTDTLYWAGLAVPPTAAFPWHVVVLTAAALAGLLASARTYPHLPGRLLRAADALLFGLLGLAGLLMAFLWFVSLHYVTGPNLNVFWAWPTHLVAAALVARPVVPAWGRTYLGAVALVTGIVAVAWPVLPQALPWAVWPVVVLTAVRAWVRSRAAEPAME